MPVRKGKGWSILYGLPLQSHSISPLFFILATAIARPLLHCRVYAYCGHDANLALRYHVFNQVLCL